MKKNSAQPPQYMRENLPKITIITPSYNQGQYIEATIQSVLSQNYPNLEYIIMDGGSTDHTVEIIKKYEKQIHYWVSEPDEGQSDAINKGLERATGDVFNWLNSDDLLAPNALCVIATTFLEKPKTSALIGCLQFFTNKTALSEPNRMSFDRVDTGKNLIFVSGMTQPSLFYRLDLVKTIGGIDKRLYYCMDLDLWVRFIAQFGSENVALTDHTLSYFRIHDSAKSQNNFQAYYERRAVFLSMLTSLGVSMNLLKQLNNGSNGLDFVKQWDFNPTFFNQKQKLIAYIIEHLLVFPHFDYPLSNSLRFWLVSLNNKVFGRRPYFYTLPLRLIYRKIGK